MTGRIAVDLGPLIPRAKVVDGIPAADKAEALRALAEAVVADGDVPVDAGTLFCALCERERLGSTGLGDGLAIPHCRVPGLDGMRLLVGRLAEPVAFDARDGKPVGLFFVVVAPDAAHGDHLKVLSGISRLCRDPDFRGACTVPDADGLCGALRSFTTRIAPAN